MESTLCGGDRCRQRSRCHDINRMYGLGGRLQVRLVRGRLSSGLCGGTHCTDALAIQTRT